MFAALDKVKDKMAATCFKRRLHHLQAIHLVAKQSTPVGDTVFGAEGDKKFFIADT